MSEQVLITKEKLNNVANKVLDITGETSGKTLDELNTTLTNVNNEITTQEELIAQLQAAVDSLPEAGGGSGEDVTAEVFEYTSKITKLETAITALENELQGKASGGGGGNTESCEVTVKRNFSPMNTEYVLYYTTPSLEIATLTVPAGDSTATIYCAKNTIIALNTYPGLAVVDGSITELSRANFCVTGSGYIALE